MAGYWISFGLLFPFILVSAISFKIWSKRFIKIEITPEMDKAANNKLIRYILFYWLWDLFYMACFMNNIVCKYIFGGLIMLIIFMNLATSFSYPKAKTCLEKVGMLQDFLIGIGLTVYLIYIIPNSNIKEIVIPIISAVYGGLITLVGVAWTIKKSDRDRKEEEVKNAKPLIFVVNKKNNSSTEINNDVKYLTSNKERGTLKKANTNDISYSIPEIILNNSDYSYTTIWGFKINDDVHIYDYGQIFPKEKTLILKNDFCFKYDDDIKYVSLLLTDMLDNLYELVVEFEIINNGLNKTIEILSVLKTKRSNLVFDDVEV